MMVGPASITIDQTHLVDQRFLDAKEIVRVFGIPPASILPGYLFRRVK